MYATIKLLRLLANVSIDEGVGQTLASNSETIQVHSQTVLLSYSVSESILSLSYNMLSCLCYPN